MAEIERDAVARLIQEVVRYAAERGLETTPGELQNWAAYQCVGLKTAGFERNYSWVIAGCLTDSDCMQSLESWLRRRHSTMEEVVDSFVESIEYVERTTG